MIARSRNEDASFNTSLYIQDLSDGRVVNIFHYTKWPDHQVPPDGNGVIALTSLVENSRKTHGHGPIIVACR